MNNCGKINKLNKLSEVKSENPANATTEAEGGESN